MDLSVIIPSYNSEKSINQCIDSVVNECTSNSLEYEIIIIDDGSTDSSPQILDELSKNNSNIKVIHQENAGPSAARNKGLEIAKGQFIALNDSDDIWLEGKLKTQIGFLKSHTDIDLIGGNSGIIRNDNERIITMRNMAFHNYFHTSTVIFRNFTNKFFFPLDMKYSEDMRFFLTIMLEHKAYYMPIMFSCNYINKISFGASGLSSNLLKMENGELQNIKFIYKNKKISLIIYISACLYSFLKFLRRLIISKINKIKKGK